MQRAGVPVNSHTFYWVGVRKGVDLLISFVYPDVFKQLLADVYTVVVFKPDVEDSGCDVCVAVAVDIYMFLSLEGPPTQHDLLPIVAAAYRWPRLALVSVTPSDTVGYNMLIEVSRVFTKGLVRDYLELVRDIMREVSNGNMTLFMVNNTPLRENVIEDIHAIMQHVLKNRPLPKHIKRVWW